MMKIIRENLHDKKRNTDDLHKPCKQKVILKGKSNMLNGKSNMLNGKGNMSKGKSNMLMDERNMSNGKNQHIKG